MSSQRVQQLVCFHCGRNDFKSPRGLQQHLNNNKECSEKERARASSQRSDRIDGIAKARDVLADSGTRLTRSQVARSAAGDASDVVQSEMDEPDPCNTGHGTGMSGLRCSMEAEASDPDEAAGESDPDDVNDFGLAEVEHSDDATDDSDRQDAEDDTFPVETQACSQGRDELLDFVKHHRFFAPLMRAETAGIELLNVLRKTKAPLNAYPLVMDWHPREKKVLKYDDQG